MSEINKGTRAMNYLIDMIAIGFVSQYTSMYTSDFMNPTYSGLLVYFLYYFFFESFSGRSLGKLVTGTCVVDLKHKKPNPLRIFARTLLRFNPLDWLSYAFGKTQGTHDILSRTRLVKMSKPELTPQKKN